jgi:predicted oxidoreductase (fatty acid repression mutant protein)
MNLKQKRIFALFVKLVLSVTLIHAQTVRDSSKQTIPHFLPAYNNVLFFKPQTVQNILPGNFYAQHLPFFCNKELQIEKAVGIPIKFRLSTVEYCNKLEGKNK